MADDNQAVASEAPETAAAAEDKVEDQSSEADVQVDSEAPEATQQSEGNAEIKAEDKAEDGLILGKFKTQEDLTKAYQSLESKWSKDAQEKAELVKVLSDSVVSEPTTDTQTAAVEGGDAFAETAEPDPVAKEIAGLKLKDAIRDFADAHNDADLTAVNEILKADPVVSGITSYEAKLEYAYLKSKNMATNKVVEDAKKQGSQEAQAKILEKQTAQVESNQKAEATDEDAELYNRATGNYSHEDRQAARREYLKKHFVDL